MSRHIEITALAPCTRLKRDDGCPPATICDPYFRNRTFPAFPRNSGGWSRAVGFISTRPAVGSVLAPDILKAGDSNEIAHAFSQISNQHGSYRAQSIHQLPQQSGWLEMCTALVIIDMQMVMQDRMDAGREHVNPDAPAKVAALVAACRQAGKPIFHVRHAESDPASPLHFDATGYQAMPCAQDAAGEVVVVKGSSSAFATTNLENHLRAANISHIYVVGAVAGFCVNSTVRSASDLGFTVSVVRDAVIGFDLPTANLDARTIFDVTMGLLEADFAEVVDTAGAISAL